MTTTSTGAFSSSAASSVLSSSATISPTSSSVATTSTGISGSASLYLYTFLATLVLLLGVSAAIVIRSIMLRRQHRRLIEEAIRNGTWVLPPAQAAKVDLSKKPRMYEVYVDKEGNMYNATWEAVTPFAAACISSPGSTHNHSDATAARHGPLRARIASVLPLWRRPRSSPRPADITSPVEISLQNLHGASLEGIHVGVLVSMPLLKTALNREEDQALPLLEFGVATIPVPTNFHNSDHQSRNPGKVSQDERHDG
ncbi:hypothetical protein FISHEDRAFT_71854 [Fistulina hepatica ATCC 64428]|uniref:Uncharacterized protein n=1 Tax=Fistulina hepatica ATCC 64428 TaxID=1128425 RepID=A0A0D7AIU8_9AGAR|nr:hypothetical protein FISHEDRAFT_71854 [Fistulina hepatica ATCC 64428]